METMTRPTDVNEHEAVEVKSRAKNLRVGRNKAKIETRVKRPGVVRGGGDNGKTERVTHIRIYVFNTHENKYKTFLLRFRRINNENGVRVFRRFCFTYAALCAHITQLNFEIKINKKCFYRRERRTKKSLKTPRHSRDYYYSPRTTVFKT